MTDLEAHPEFLGAIVDQQDGEDAVIDNGADEVGDAMHQGIQIERGIEGIGERMQEFDLMDGIDADIRRLLRLLGARPVVSLEGVLGCGLAGRRGGRGGSASLFIGRRHTKSR